ncbi:MAG: pyridoxal phosphate-dependent aminotransferase [Candidatus Magnetomorum sp.]|nr:pyridoxal phosphate-dependent aminotransferase [Candidatus Magnetomorum sp.]
MPISTKIKASLTRTSWIRKMFEEGGRLKQLYGDENVFDFSIGNPNLDPPESFHQTIKHLIDNHQSGQHGYMPNVGYIDVRQSVAEYLSTEQGITLSPDDLIMTCGAAGALNVIFKAILDPGDQVICPSPYFVEYGFYVDNHGGTLKTVPSTPDFYMDIDAIGKAIEPNTKAILINSPNNPTGQVYSRGHIEMLAHVLEQKSKANGRSIYLISDEPYRKISYDNIKIPGILSCYENSIVCTSYSKDLSIPGERIGHLAVHPKASDKSDLMQALAMANRILGFVNAPALMQRVVARMQGKQIDSGLYQSKRDLLCSGLKKAGYMFTVPKGAFYLFPKSPIPDDVAFVGELQKENILAVPGSGFGCPGHFRISYCVSDDTIVRSMPGFERVMKKLL